MRLRMVILDDDPGVRYALRLLCARRGHEVFIFPHPGLCPLQTMARCPCSPGTVCADLLLSDLHMPEVEGLDFVEGLVAKGCLLPHLALMSAAWSVAAQAHAVRLGCRAFSKPFLLPDLLAWFDDAEAQAEPPRALLNWREQWWRVGRPVPGL